MTVTAVRIALEWTGLGVVLVLILIVLLLFAFPSLCGVFVAARIRRCSFAFFGAVSLRDVATIVNVEEESLWDNTDHSVDGSDSEEKGDRDVGAKSGDVSRQCCGNDVACDRVEGVGRGKQDDDSNANEKGDHDVGAKPGDVRGRCWGNNVCCNRVEGAGREPAEQDDADNAKEKGEHCAIQSSAEAQCNEIAKDEGGHIREDSCSHGGSYLKTNESTTTVDGCRTHQKEGTDGKGMNTKGEERDTSLNGAETLNDANEQRCEESQDNIVVAVEIIDAESPSPRLPKRESVVMSAPSQQSRPNQMEGTDQASVHY